MDLQLLCWECHKPIADEGLPVFTNPDSPWSQSTTRICADCLVKRYPPMSDRCVVCRILIPTWYDPEFPDVCWKGACRVTCRDRHNHFPEEE